MSPMKRGDVWWVNFDPSVGGEIQRERPAVIISNDMANRFLNRVQVVPITSNIDRLYPSEAYVTINGTQHWDASPERISRPSSMRSRSNSASPERRAAEQYVQPLVVRRWSLVVRRPSSVVVKC
jgi:mRNA interferase MazF